MRVRVANHSGFCFGVKRAIKIAEKTLASSKGSKNIYSLGSIIHNPQVVGALSKKGLKVIKDIIDARSGTIIISSHGAPIEIVNKIKKKKLALVDATCPFVKNAHNIVKDLKSKGYDVIVIGDKKHPEVKALLSLTGNRGTTPRTKSPILVRGARKLAFGQTRNHAEAKNKRIAFVSQTTQSKDNYLRGIFDILKEDFSEARIFNTICSDTAQRQALAKKFLKECDVMMVVGGKDSANTRRLYQICRESGVDSHHIETEKEIKKKWFFKKRSCGVVSGASTPDEMVKKVTKKISEVATYGTK
ncbi:MAG: 4-hydroxy-3-methylbut-2-enyl diphosphate reductase [Candidatus Omnitrophica bacterium]|nr:4-hydroxy-3-methylbut-2-enyl diphosphate reductase [Candidatus Omnitrophota bacterium]